MPESILNEAQVKEAIREEFARNGIILSEEELNELFGKSRLIKKIKKLDPDGSEMDKLGYDAEEVFAGRAGKGSLKAILGDLEDVVGDRQKRRDFFKK